MPTTIDIRGIQIRSTEKAMRLAAAVADIDEECGVGPSQLTVSDCYVGDVDLAVLEDGTPMERKLAGMISGAASGAPAEDAPDA